MVEKETDDHPQLEVVVLEAIDRYLETRHLQTHKETHETHVH